MTPLILAALIGPTVSSKAPAAPDLFQAEWINSEKPIKLSDLKGSVTVLHFWTFACNNCQANLPRYNKWFDKYTPLGVKFLSIHTPEIKSEYNIDNVKKAVTKWGIKYPVLIDNDYSNWKAWQQEYWPTVYLIDKKGKVRYHWAGELEYNNAGGDITCRRIIERLIAEK